MDAGFCSGVGPPTPRKAIPSLRIILQMMQMKIFAPNKGTLRNFWQRPPPPPRRVSRQDPKWSSNRLFDLFNNDKYLLFYCLVELDDKSFRVGVERREWSRGGSMGPRCTHLTIQNMFLPLVCTDLVYKPFPENKFDLPPPPLYLL